MEIVLFAMDLPDFMATIRLMHIDNSGKALPLYFSYFPLRKRMKSYVSYDGDRDFLVQRAGNKVFHIFIMTHELVWLVSQTYIYV